MCKTYTTTNGCLRTNYTLVKKIIKNILKRLRLLKNCYIIDARLY